MWELDKDIVGGIISGLVSFCMKGILVGKLSLGIGQFWEGLTLLVSVKPSPHLSYVINKNKESKKIQLIVSEVNKFEIYKKESKKTQNKKICQYIYIFF